MALTPFDMEGVNRDLLAAGNPAKPDMQSILRRNARDLVLGNAILVSSVDAKELEFGVHMAYSDADGGFDTDPSEDVWFEPTPAKQEKDELSAGACDPADPLNLEQSSSYGMTR